jgi:hypothetical protein
MQNVGQALATGNSKAFHVPLAKGAFNLREKGIIVLAWVPVAVDTVGEH